MQKPQSCIAVSRSATEATEGIPIYYQIKDECQEKMWFSEELVPNCHTGTKIRVDK